MKQFFEQRRRGNLHLSAVGTSRSAARVPIQRRTVYVRNLRDVPAAFSATFQFQRPYPQVSQASHVPQQAQVLRGPKTAERFALADLPQGFAERFCSSTSKDRPRYSKRHGCVHRPWLAGRLFTHADSRQCPDRAKHMAPCTNTSKSTPGNASASARICLKPSSRARLIRSTPASRQNATAAPFTEWACVDKCSGTDGQCFFASQITPGSAAMRPSTPFRANAPTRLPRRAIARHTAWR